MPSAGATPTTGGDTIALPPGYTAQTFATGGALTGPDDISRLDGNIYVAYQNGVGAMGEPSPSGATASTLVEYSPAGTSLARWNLTGKIDGMSADTANHRIVATVNEDGNSSLYTVTPGATGPQVQHYAYTGLTHGGGTDAISFVNGAMYVSASNPAPDANGTTFSKPALYRVTLSGTTATATPVLRDNSTAIDAGNGKPVTLNLSDPDSNEVIPAQAPQYAGDLLLTSQGDSEQIYLSNPGTPRQTATLVKLNTQVDDTAVTTGAGTLYVVDGATDKVIVISGPFSAGQIFTSVPNDSKVNPGTLGDLDLKTGSVSPFGKGFGSPKGLLFLP
ncbi:hypothetical protein HFP15_37445 [Amycolatopsis sp. K13G38]|uniref:Uncharacterized protein n=1 Tax=Amycolatopsis acididurans TaxID=2724524 RepID=A0ABX1JFH4_9PSEU|nr:hypothetical protein [Amycolatopsis acididurans]NKQ58547.1 hypothetical protein [Amycolatopsis acididurans]